jgi:putative AbiEi antitoxin of type IV toxin-antitoxin system
MHELPSTSARQVFSRRDALAAGWTPDALACAVRAGRLTRVRRGVYRRVDPPLSNDFVRRRDEHAAAAIGAVVGSSTAVASHGSAAVLHDLPLLELPHRPCITVPPGFAGRIAAAHLHRAALPVRHVVDVGGVRVTSPERTVLDVAREHGIVAGVVVADAALRLGLTDEASLQRCLAECAGWRGLACARRAVFRADSRSESPLETLSRLALVDRGITPLHLQPVIHDSGGRAIGRVDFYWDAGVVGEADGMEKYGAEFGRLRDEKLRQERLERAGLIVVRWGWSDVEQRMDDLVERLHAALRQASARPPSGRRWSARLAPRFVADPALYVL